MRYKLHPPSPSYLGERERGFRVVDVNSLDNVDHALAPSP